MEYSRRQYSAQHRLSATLTVVVFALAIVVTGHTRADPYLPIYHDAASADILLLENDVAFRFLPDIDGDGWPETLTVGKGPGCNASVIHRSIYLSHGALSTSDAAGQWRLFDSGDGCSLAGRTDVIGDVNGDGRRDLLYALHDYESGIDKTGLIFTPASSGDIDIAGLDGRSGFVLEGQLFVRDAGDVNGDGFDDFIVDADHVIAGAAGYAAQYSNDTLPDGMLVKSTLHGDGFTRIGDLDGDGYDDLLLGHINTLNAYAIVYGAADLSKNIDEFDDLDSDGGAFMQQCAYSFGCSILHVGDVDGDGFGDMVVSFFGCGYANEAAVLYGSAKGVPLRASLDDYLPGEITRVTDNVSGGCLSGRLSGSPGDIDADGYRDIVITGLDGTARTAVLFGRGGDRPAWVSVDALDGTDGVLLNLALLDEYRQGYSTRDNTGLDVDGDGYVDLVEIDNYWMYMTDPEILEEFGSVQLALGGKPRKLDDRGPDRLVAEQIDSGWHFRWLSPVNGTPARYRILVDGEAVATLDSMTRQYVLPREVAMPPFRLDVQALADNDAVIGTTIRQVAANYEDEALSAIVYGPTLVELAFNRQEPWTSRTMRYQIWRNCEFLTLAPENAAGYWDSTIQPGQSYTYYLTPLYSRFNDVSSQAALRDYPPLQWRSNSVTVVTPSATGNVEPAPLACLNVPSVDGDGDGASESVTVNGLVIAWTAEGWHQVQSLDDYRSWCEGGLQCEVQPGTYVVINHTTGERIEPVIVTGDSTDDSSGPVVDGNTIHWTDDGWYQVQDAITHESMCEGVRTCVVPNGRYIVINHTTGLRNENVIVYAGNSGASGGIPGDNDDPGAPTGVDTLAPSNLRLDIYGPAIAELFWDNAAGVVNTEVYRDGTLLGISPGSSYFDGTRQAGYPHRYALVAIDGSGQRSATVDYGYFEDVSVEIPGYFGGHNEDTIAMSGNIAVMSAYTGAGARTIQVLERSDAGHQDWRITHTFPMDKEFLWDSAIALDTDTIVFASLRYDDVRSYYENDLDYADYYEYDFLFMTRGDSDDWTMQPVTGFSDALQPNLPSQYVSVTVEGDTAMLGGRNGAVYVFSRSSDGQWTETQKLTSPNANHFGYSLSLDGDTAAIGRVAYFDSDVNGPPTAVVFTRDNAGFWSEQQVLQPGADNGEGLVDMVVDGDTLLMTGDTQFDAGEYSTQHYIYIRTSGQWALSQQIGIDSYGTSIALDDGKLVIGAPGQDGGSVNTGLVHVFERAASGNWLETHELFAGTTIDGFGSDTALSLNTVFAIGGQDNTSRGFFYALP